ncbi:type II toxin-antitoxin system RelE/ParE family toxin [Neisseria sp. ZJ106]|uniref:Type II toxin-antitoxin system RelE/ParE family toxin n=1 Tax=Neisseria lisongii TaxID=2912188 RepID=A0ABY7RJT2_9NEIS|nr:type II toxin-antitoxin system RelE/ParE family toxin [Neisseria lisongii]MCF7520453.1 type II toxin-antitoxin system RelE/ParE family toxin [Neisseria lisongii]WCL71604.1 type II toxin-antitoxin system RelE/ParE family toxin [Neisseria lisongii]
MYTIVESVSFKTKAADLFTIEQRLEFFTYLALNPLAGDVIPNGGGLRKIRWKLAGRGKRGGVRVIYFNMLSDGFIYVADIYSKSEKENLSPKEIKALKGNKS